MFLFLYEYEPDKEKSLQPQWKVLPVQSQKGPRRAKLKIKMPAPVEDEHSWPSGLHLKSGTLLYLRTVTMVGMGDWNEWGQGLDDMLLCLQGAALFSANGGTWHKLPDYRGKKTEELSKIRQGPRQSCQDFVSHLLQSVVLCLDGDADAELLAIKHLAYEMLQDG